MRQFSFGVPHQNERMMWHRSKPQCLSCLEIRNPRNQSDQVIRAGKCKAKQLSIVLCHKGGITGKVEIAMAKDIGTIS